MTVDQFRSIESHMTHQVEERIWGKMYFSKSLSGCYVGNQHFYM